MSLPKGFKRLEYIQSSGTQFVDTGIVAKSSLIFRVKFDMQSSIGHNIAGCWVDSTHLYRFFTYNNQGYIDIGNGTSKRIIGGSIPYNTICEMEAGNLYIKNLQTGEIVSSGDPVAEFTLTTNVCLGGTSREQESGKYYYLQIYDGAELVCDLVPCINDAGNVGMWDEASKAFCPNAGTGEFIAGPPANTVDITPTMTSDTAPAGYAVTASSVHGSYAAWYAFDGVDSTTEIGNRIWHSGAGLPQWIMLQLPEAAKVTFFSVKNRADIDTGKPYGPTAFELQGSNDGSGFTTLGAYTASEALGAESLHRVSNPGKYKYYRLYITDTGYVVGSSKYAVVDQIRFYEPLSLVPDAPQKFRVETEMDTLVTLAWDAVSDAVGYRLYRTGQLLADTEETSVAVAVEPFAGAVFTVTAYNENGEGAASTLTYYSVPEDPILFLITDRTQQDVTERNPKGYYAASDLNRVGYAMNYVAERISEQGVQISVSPRTDWTDADWMAQGDAVAYLEYLSKIRNAVSVLSTTPAVPNDLTGFTFEEANNIELILLDIDQMLTYVYANLLYAGEIFAGEV